MTELSDVSKADDERWSFSSRRLAQKLKAWEIAQLVVAGIGTDHCVTTSVRWARDMDVVRQWSRVRKGKIVIISDATACFSKVARGINAEMVQSAAR